MKRLAAVAALALVGCAGQSAATHNKRIVDDAPRWMTEKDQVRVEIVDKLLQGGDTVHALAIIQEMREDGVKRPDLDLYQGMALHQQGMVDDAERMLDMALDNMPRNAKVHRSLCVLYADTDRVEQAIESCVRATKLAPDDGAAWNNLGFLQLRTDPEAARSALQKAVDADPTEGKYRNNLAYAQAAAGDHRAALRTFLTTGTPADAHYNVGTAFEHAGDATRALSYYQRALTYDSDHTLAADAVLRLRPAPSKTAPGAPSEEM